jgi:hypothetical protein
VTWLYWLRLPFLALLLAAALALLGLALHRHA